MPFAVRPVVPRLLILSDDESFVRWVQQGVDADPLLRARVIVVDPRQSEPAVLDEPPTVAVVPPVDTLSPAWRTFLEQVPTYTGREPSDHVVQSAIRYNLLRAQYESLWSDWQQANDRARELDMLRRRVTPFDPRTGWHTHAHIVDRCQEEIARSMRYGLPISLVVVDILRGEVGEQALDGDFSSELVTALATRIRPICRHGDILGHYGPTSILVILLNTDQVGGERFSERARQSLLPPLVVDDVAHTLSWSMAVVARDPGVSTTPTLLLNQLERRVERARLLGARGVVVSDESWVS